MMNYTFFLPSSQYFSLYLVLYSPVRNNLSVFRPFHETFFQNTVPYIFYLFPCSLNIVSHPVSRQCPLSRVFALRCEQKAFFVFVQPARFWLCFMTFISSFLPILNISIHCSAFYFINRSIC